MPALTADRASKILSGLEHNQLQAEAEEMDEILAAALAIEADPKDLAVAGWLRPLVHEHTRCAPGDPRVIPALEVRLAELLNDLKSDWWRMTSSRETIRSHEEDVVQVRRALGTVRDTALITRLIKISHDSLEAQPNMPWVTSAALGYECYAITKKGHRLRRALSVRAARFANVSLKGFLHSYEKTEGKMRAFGNEIKTLSNNIGYVKKNREQVVIGLAKAGVPASHALGHYHAVVGNRAADVAVTCARNAKTFGTPQQAAHRLAYAERSLLQAGFPNTPVVLGCAKALVSFEPIETGLKRFRELQQRLQSTLGGQGELTFKYAARLMSATGMPDVIVARVQNARDLLGRMPSRVAQSQNLRPYAVALAGMVKTPEALPDLVKRFRTIEEMLVKQGLSAQHLAADDALECVACAGTPEEVIDTVSALLEQLAEGRSWNRADLAVAVAFAKRFAY